MTSPSKRKVFIAFSAVYIIWGSTYLAIRFTIETLPPLMAAGIRFLTAGIILYTLMRLWKKEPPPGKVHWKSAIILGALLLLGGNGSVVWAEQFVPSGLASLVIATIPLWMVLLQWLWMKEKRPPLGIFAGIAIGLVGVWLLIAPTFARITESFHFQGMLILLLAALLWSLGSVYSRKAPQPQSPFLSIGMQMISGGIMLLIAGFLRGEAVLIQPENFSLKSIAALLYLISFGSFIGFTAYIWLLKNVGVAKTSTYAFVNPVVAVFLGWAFAGETLNRQTFIAAFFILMAIITITIQHRKPKTIAGS